MKKKALILYTSVGLGHKSIAENIAFYLAEAGGETRLADIGAVQEGRFKQAVVGFHKFIHKYFPFVWGWLYRRGHFLILPFRRQIAGFNFKNTEALLKEFIPDLVITTQTAASAVISYLKKRGFYKGLFVVAFSDFHLHPYWLYDNADFYLVNIEEQKQEMIGRGVDERKIFVCGMTLKPKRQINAKAVKRKFGIDQRKKIILVGSGSLGYGVDGNLIEQLAAFPEIAVVAVCGKNKFLFENLAQRFAGSDAIILGYYTPMDELYAIADIFITKPGGLSISEALLWQLPIVISHVLPGQEEKNYQFLLIHKLVGPDSSGLIGDVLEELRTGNFKKTLAHNPEIPKIIKPPETVLGFFESLLNRQI